MIFYENFFKKNLAQLKSYPWTAVTVLFWNNKIKFKFI